MTAHSLSASRGSKPWLRLPSRDDARWLPLHAIVRAIRHLHGSWVRLVVALSPAEAASEP
ncbi:MAG TPA: hypothetical protein VNF73_03685 [Candidatus Saccharimonadales bacterium]|nr:hypothetical protein [Candidatus Saccharimonadales bacterium]